MKNSKSTTVFSHYKFLIFTTMVSVFWGCKSTEINPESEYVIIPDSNFEKALIKSGIDDIQDGRVLRANVIKVTSLPYFSTKGYGSINDLIGIAAFTNLESLNISNANLTSIDISKNVALKGLSCNGNNLTGIDISKNSNLQFLDCSDNLFTRLDVSKNPQLTGLICSENQISNLELSNNKNLTVLFCASNQLTNLDISKNTLLEMLGCNNNNLTNLNISKNISLNRFIVITII